MICCKVNNNNNNKKSPSRVEIFESDFHWQSAVESVGNFFFISHSTSRQLFREAVRILVLQPARPAMKVFSIQQSDLGGQYYCRAAIYRTTAKHQTVGKYNHAPNSS